MMRGCAPLTASTPHAFDAVAADYDARCAAPLFARMRAEVQRLATDAFPRGCRVLEIGCGTGLDSDFLVSCGVQLVATDPSSEMLQRAEARLAGRAPAIRCAVDDADVALAAHDPTLAPFDGLFSDFGALNCVADLEPLARLANRRLVPGGRMVICLMSRYCLWEIATHLVLQRPAVARRRLARDHGPVMVPVGGVDVPTFYHHPSAVMRALGGSYRLRRVRGLAVALPPPYLEGAWHRVPEVLRRILAVVDRGLADRWPFNRLGDHFVMEIVKS